MILGRSDDFMQPSNAFFDISVFNRIQEDERKCISFLKKEPIVQFVKVCWALTGAFFDELDTGFGFTQPKPTLMMIPISCFLEMLNEIVLG